MKFDKTEWMISFKGDCIERFTHTDTNATSVYSPEGMYLGQWQPNMNIDDASDAWEIWFGADIIDGVSYVNGKPAKPLSQEFLNNLRAMCAKEVKI